MFPQISNQGGHTNRVSAVDSVLFDLSKKWAERNFIRMVMTEEKLMNQRTKKTEELRTAYVKQKEGRI